MVAFNGVVSAQEDWLSLAGAVTAAVMKCWPSDIMPAHDSHLKPSNRPVIVSEHIASINISATGLQSQKPDLAICVGTVVAQTPVRVSYISGAL